MAKRHFIKADGIKELLKYLPKTIRQLQMVFGIPKVCESDYSRPQKVPKAESLARYAAQLEINQFRLVFTDYSMQGIAFHGPFTIEEEQA